MTKKTGTLTHEIKGQSDILLFEFHALTCRLLESFHVHGQELLLLDEITDAVSEFADTHKPKTKGDKKDD